MEIRLKRAYEPPLPDDGVRILVDRLWPRGLSKEKARIDLWVRDLAPSTELRKWFAHDPGRWEEFLARYFAELDDKAEAVLELIRHLDTRTTFVFSARSSMNNALALKHYLKERVSVVGG